MDVHGLTHVTGLLNLCGPHPGLLRIRGWVCTYTAATLDGQLLGVCGSRESARCTSFTFILQACAAAAARQVLCAHCV
jgi:hypothetical protein